MSKRFRSGVVAIVGLPNVGKSTLLNRLLGQKIAIVSPRPQTTRDRILGVKHLPTGQIVLVDTPGLHRPHGKGRSELNRYMVQQAEEAIADVDAVLVLVEAPHAESRRAIGREYDLLLQTLEGAKKPTVLVINKIDLLRKKGALLPVLEEWSRRYPFRALIPISAAKGEGTDRVVDELMALLPEGEKLFPDDALTDRPVRWLASELVREQVFVLTREEVPYAVAVTIDSFEERDRDVMIRATIHVEKEAQKRILVGGAGRMVREIGARARREIGELVGRPAHLTLFVRVDTGWSQDPHALEEMGYGG